MNAPLRTGDLARVQTSLGSDFEQLYRQNHAFVWRCARRMGVDEDEIDDVIQDVFVIAYRRRARLEPEVAPSTWLFGILRNVLRNRGRTHARHLRRVEAFGEHVDARERWRRRHETSLGERFMAGDLLAGFLHELSEDQRAVFVLAELEGYTGKEIAEALAINPNTAHSRLRLARRAFCAHFGVPPNGRASATGELRERTEQPPSGASAHAWGLVVAALARPAWWSGAGAVIATFSAQAKLALAGLAVLSIGIGAHLLGAPPSSDPAPAGAETAQLEPAAQRDPVTLAQAGGGSGGLGPRELESTELDPIVVSASASAASAAPARASGRSSAALVRADEQLRLARAALIDGEADRALAALDAIPDRDPSLLEQRAATRVAAHCLLGQRDAARRVVEGLRTASPDAAILSRIDAACW